jgi:membrane-associated phospholipid phosphatase
MLFFHHKKSIKLKIAYLISRLSDPVTWLVPIGVLMLYYSNLTQQQWFWLVGFVLFILSLPIILIISKLKKKKISDIDLTKKEERTPIYITVVILWAIALIILKVLNGPKLIFVTLLTGELLALVILFVNLKWKISNHGAISSFAPIFLGVVVRPTWYWLLLWIPLVGWSRIVQKKHTLPQFIAGAALGSIYFFMLKIFGY